MQMQSTMHQKTNANTSAICVTEISVQAMQRSLKSCYVDSTPEVVVQGDENYIKAKETI